MPNPNIAFPPQPKLEDFFLDGAFYALEYDKALKAWERVCHEFIKILAVEACR